MADLLTAQHVESKITTIFLRWITQREVQKTKFLKSRSVKWLGLKMLTMMVTSLWMSVISKNDFEHWTEEVKGLRRIKAKINDELLSLNIKTEIDLTAGGESSQAREFNLTAVREE